MRTTAPRPVCPGCRQSWSSVYNGRLGCTRCGTLGPIAKPPVAAVPKVLDLMQALKTSLAAGPENSTAAPVR